MVFVPEPVCWTEVPKSWKVLGRQRRRWSHGLGQLVWKHKRMIGNPRFGAVGRLALPFFLLFELLGPVVEVLGLISLAVSAGLGVLDLGSAAIMMLLAVTRRNPGWTAMPRTGFIGASSEPAADRPVLADV
jgi:cellulose synthase/poly-beta-1,6-N-acetylglucosamine synthase-like glycosyltransferase